MYQPYDNKYGYRKAIIREEDRAYFEDLGFSTTIKTFAEVSVETSGMDLDLGLGDEPADSADLDLGLGDPDTGDGEVGSLKWHILKVQEIKAKKLVIIYIKKVTGHKMELANNSTLNGLKESGIKLIEAFLILKAKEND